MQLLVTSKMSKEANLWLRSMTNDLNDLDAIDRVSREYLENKYDELYKLVMDVIIRSNKEKFSKVKSMCEALRQLKKQLIWRLVRRNNSGKEKKRLKNEQS